MADTVLLSQTALNTVEEARKVIGAMADHFAFSYEYHYADFTKDDFADVYRWAKAGPLIPSKPEGHIHFADIHAAEAKQIGKRNFCALLRINRELRTIGTNAAAFGERTPRGIVLPAPTAEQMKRILNETETVLASMREDMDFLLRKDVGEGMYFGNEPRATTRSIDQFIPPFQASDKAKKIDLVREKLATVRIALASEPKPEITGQRFISTAPIAEAPTRDRSKN